MIRQRGDYMHMVKQLCKIGADFKLQSTTKSKIVIYKGTKYLFADSHFNNSDLGLFQKLKREVRKNIEDKKLIPPEFEKSKYFRTEIFKPIGKGEYLEFDDVLEFDINKAYYKAALILGYISEQFYKACLELKKDLRLALIGSLATKKITLIYEDGKLNEEKHDVTEDTELRKVFFHLVTYIDRCLFSFSELAGDNFLMYWVDGIYLKNYPRKEQHKKMISEKFDVDFSTEILRKIVIINESVTSTVILVDTGKMKWNEGTGEDELHVKRFYLNTIFLRDGKRNR